MNIRIEAITYYLPETILTNESISKEFDKWSAEEIYKKTGIRKRHISDEADISSDLAVKAAEKLFEEHDIKKEEIQYLIFCTQSFDQPSPTTACMIQDRLGLSINIGAIDIGLGCSGFVYSLSIAAGLIMTEQVNNVLIITAETLTKYLHSRDWSTRTIFGDGSAAIYLTKDNQSNIGKYVFGSDGSGVESMILKYRGFRFPSRKVSGIDFADEYGNISNYECFRMNGPEVLVFALKTVPKLVSKILEKNGVVMEDIDLFIFHQANFFLLNKLRKRLKIPEDKFFVNIAEVGNTVSSSIPIALADAMRQGKAKRGDTILFAAFGVGLSWAGTVIKL